MRPITKLFLIGGAILLGIAAWSVRPLRTVRQAPEIRPVATQETPVPTPVALEARTPAPQSGPAEPIGAPKTTERESLVPRADDSANVAERWLAAAESAGFVQLRLTQTTQLTLASFADFFAQAGLTPEQVKQLGVLLTEKRLGATNVAVAQLRAGIVPDPESPAFIAALMADRARMDQEIKAYLGDERFRDLENYLRAREEVAVFTRVNRAIGDTPNALTPSQAAQLQQLLRASSAARLSPAVIAQAGAFLSGPQLEALQDAQEMQEEIFRQRNRQALPPRPKP